MFADARTPGHNPDTDKAEVPEAPQLCVPCDGDVERASQLYGAVHACRGGGAVGGVDGVGDVVGSVNL